eukprot:TRINITY_DN77721_c0_g1_i1.p1 TRINITY_DN77721_c0_g1~~TRINITY_DN77721_c0_g1_i1.p1  ORF type:complete len:438 (-),score=62.70 TRINITY_DN77721_c0_g1_i1:82-1395(-)
MASEGEGASGLLVPEGKEQTSKLSRGQRISAREATIEIKKEEDGFAGVRTESLLHLPEFLSGLDEPLPESLASLAGEIKIDGVYGTEVKIDADAWGATFVTIVRIVTVIQLMQKNSAPVVVHLARVAFMILTILTNLTLQITVVLYISWYIVEPGVANVQESYMDFLRTVLDKDGNLKDAAWAAYDRKAEVCGLALLHRTFCYSMCMLWVLVGMNEARNVQRMLFHVWRLPTVEKVSSMLSFVQTRNFAVDGKCHVIGVTWPVRLSVILTVCLPRFWITIYLAMMGCRWLCSSRSPGEMILDSLKLAFVHKIDEVVYEVVLPLASRQQIHDTKMFFKTGTTPSSLRQISSTELNGYSRSCFYVVLTAVCVFGYIELYQTVLPGDLRHLHGLCGHWQNEIAKTVCHSRAFLGSQGCYPAVNMTSFEHFNRTAYEYRVY